MVDAFGAWNEQPLADWESGWYFPIRKVLSAQAWRCAMTNKVRPHQAAGALAEIAHRRAQVVDLAVLPTWFWWATSALMVGFSIAVETRQPLAISIATAAFVAGTLSVIGRLVLGNVARAKPRHDLFGSTGVLAILGFV